MTLGNDSDVHSRNKLERTSDFISLWKLIDTFVVLLASVYIIIIDNLSISCHHFIRKYFFLYVYKNYIGKKRKIANLNNPLNIHPCKNLFNLLQNIEIFHVSKTPFTCFKIFD